MIDPKHCRGVELRVSRSPSLGTYLVLFLNGAAVRVGLRMASAHRWCERSEKRTLLMYLA